LYSSPNTSRVIKSKRMWWSENEQLTQKFSWNTWRKAASCKSLA
jgi:hypothetical protein